VRSMLGRVVMTCDGNHAWKTAVKSTDPNCECWWQECQDCSDFEELYECENCYYKRLEEEDREEGYYDY